MESVLQQLQEIREDVAYIKGRIDSFTDQGNRIDVLERRWWQLPLVAILAVLGRPIEHFLG